MAPFAHDFRYGIGRTVWAKPKREARAVVLQQKLVAARKGVGERVAVCH